MPLLMCRMQFMIPAANKKILPCFEYQKDGAEHEQLLTCQVIVVDLLHFIHQILHVFFVVALTVLAHVATIEC